MTRTRDSSDHVLLGRSDEVAALGAAIASARDGRGAALVVHGAAGVGKTSLLGEAARTATDFQISHVTVPETELAPAYGALARLLSPFVPALERLPISARDTLRPVFGLASATPGDRHLVGLAALELLSEVAVGRPVLCIVDDAHWLDMESRDALGLVARRLGADRVTVLFGVRETPNGAGWYADLPGLGLAGLADDAAIELIEQVARRPLTPDESRRIAVETGGSPMAIIELTTELTNGLERQSPPSPGALGLPDLSRRLEGHFLRQVRSLPAEAQELLLVAAVDDSGEPAVVTRASARLGVSNEAARSVADAGLLSLSTEVRFRHPLLRSAVLRSAPPSARRRAHLALAEATDPRRPARRAWHRSAATSEPDDELAADLQRVAGQESRRGANTAAGALLARAAELSTVDADRVDRVLSAAQAYGAAGAHATARALLARWATLFSAPRDRARALRLHGALRYDAGEARGTAQLLLEAARALQPVDIGEARAALLQAFAAARVTGRFALPGEGVVAVSAAARAMPLPANVEPTVADLLLDGDATLFLEGHQAAVPMLSKALEQMGSTRVGGPDRVLWLAMGSWAAGAIGDDIALHALTGRLVDEARREGALGGLAHGLLYAGMSELFSGSLDAARAHFTERAHLLDVIGLQADVGELITLAWTGREAEARAEAKSVAAHAATRCYGWMLVFVEYALCVLDLGLGHYRAAFDVAPKQYDDSPFVCQMAFPDLIEAAVRCGERSFAERALEELASRALTNRTPLSLGLLARCRALLADDANASDLFVESFEHLGRSRSRIQLARTRLLYGEWLRRRKQRVESRDELRAALDVFEQLGAAAFAVRARRELEATGERARRRVVDVADQLTAQEREIAALASTGATNADIAQRLFLSAATVDYHLRKVYRKLDIGSRRDLADSLHDRLG
jgi:DNA-binding CsgD family transcriptional regulator